MIKRIKLSALTFALALALAAITGAPGAELEAQEEDCFPVICEVGGQQGICCLLIDPTPVSCDPCGGFNPG